MQGRQLFLMDPPPEQVDQQHDTTYVLIAAAAQRNYQTWVAPAAALFYERGAVQVCARPFSSGLGSSEQAARASVETVRLADFSVVWLREDPPFDRDYLYSTYLLDRANVPVINNPAGVRNSNEKLFIFEFPDLIPRSWAGADLGQALKFIERVGGRAVLKSLSGYGGEEVYLLSGSGESSEKLFRRETVDGSRPVMLQEFLPSVRERGDRRLILLDGEPLGGLTRYPADGDFRANLHSGGRAGEAYVKDSEAAICRQLKPTLKRRGLFLVGVDLIDDKITEINVTSPTCVQEINRETGGQLEERIVDRALELAGSF